jgi:hypothetical protein
MLNKLSEQIRECLEHAEDCARKAAAQPDGSALKQDFLNLEKHWQSLAQSLQLGEQLTDFTNESRRSLAQSMQFSEQLTDFTNESSRKPSTSFTPFLRGQAFDPETVEAMGKALVSTCEALGLSNRNDAMTKVVAEKIIELGQRGIKNPTALHFAAMKEFRSDPQ